MLGSALVHWLLKSSLKEHAQGGLTVMSSPNLDGDIGVALTRIHVKRLIELDQAEAEWWRGLMYFPVSHP